MNLAVWICASLSAASLALATHPFVTFPLSLGVLANRRPRPIAEGGRPPSRVAVCVCAYNEAGVIAARVENLLAARRHFPDLEILIYVDAASDSTESILRSFGDAIRLVVSRERRGKTHGMNRLVAMTDAEIIVFSDANVTFAHDAIPRLVAPFADPAVGCACGHLLYVDPDAASSTAATGSLYWRLEERIKSLESATGSVMGADGSIFALRRSLHRPPPESLIDDMYVSLSVLCEGWRVVRVSDAVAFEASVSRPAEEFRRKIRIACQAFNVNRALWPRLVTLPLLDRYKYLSHKLLRWLSIYFLCASAIFFLLAALFAAGATAFAFCTAILSVSGMLIFRARSGPLGKLREVMAALVATGFGVWRSWRGDTFQTWTPPASARATETPALSAKAA